MHVIAFAKFCMLIAIARQTLGDGSENNKTLTIAYMIPWTQEWEVGPLMGSGFVLGLETVKERGLLPGYNIKWTWRDTYCKPLRGIKMAVEIWSEVEDLDAIIGDGCSTICEPVSLLASAWGIPMISWGCTSLLLSDKEIHPTFSRTVGPWTLLAPMFDRLADQFGWTRVGILTETAVLMSTTAEATKKEMERRGKRVFFYTIETTVDGDKINPSALAKQQQIVRSMKRNVRAIFILTYGNDFRNFLVTAHDEGMLTPGYAYVAMDIAHILRGTHSYRPELDPLIYEGVIIGTPTKPSGVAWDTFAQKVIEEFQNPAFRSVRHLPVSATLDRVEVHAGMVHDAVLLWALAVNLTLEQGHKSDNGLKITENIFNMTFEGISGNVAIDARGDRNPNYKLEIVEDGKLIPMMGWDASQQRLFKEHNPEDPEDWSGIVWPGGGTSVPEDSPKCGWNKELCSVDAKKNIIIRVLVPVVILFVVMTAAAIAMWKLRHEQALKEATSCCIPYKDIEILNPGTIRTSFKSLTSASASLKLNFSVLLGRVRNDIVVIKTLEDININITDRNVLQDLKNMKDVKHENLNSFIGISLEQNAVYTLMMYASHGSLWDVLAEPQTKLTWDFKVSLLHDIAQGLKYLHSSDIVSHGRLTSKNCIVDKRWTCKITDYGLGNIRNHKSGLNPTDLLWTAPEMLRTNTLSCGTQPGDIYSFGIISQETVMQDQPFAANQPQLDPSDVIAELKKPSKSLMRPRIPPGTCNSSWIRMMESCWTEIPTHRPSIKRVINLLKEINGGRPFSLVDNMVARLEGYTKNLEDIVSERSSELEEEKSKLEHLLLELLPISVADQLKLGRPVLPEYFENVTILFSDIVSFTRISAGGGPTDVVNMLNFVYTLFDDVCAKYDVYKVATIGDAYFLASGVPVRNGDNHASEICNLTLDLLNSGKNLPIPHMPQETLKMRFGVHSGPCAAGVAGMKMPRYLLFGESVDIASNVESASESMRIHLSYTTADLVKDLGRFNITSRDKIHIQGLGDTTTYWLEGKMQ